MNEIVFIVNQSKSRQLFEATSAEYDIIVSGNSLEEVKKSAKSAVVARFRNQEKKPVYIRFMFANKRGSKR